MLSRDIMVTALLVAILFQASARQDLEGGPTLPLDVVEQATDKGSYTLGQQLPAGLQPRRALHQIDFSQRTMRPSSHPAGTSSGAANTANIGLSSAPSTNRRIGALGYTSDVAASNSLSAADTLVVAGVRGNDNGVAGSGGGRGAGSGSIGSNRGYSSTGKKRVLLQNTDSPAKRHLLQRASVGAQPKAVGGTSTSLMGSDRSAGTQSRADVSTGVYGTGSGSSGSNGSINMGHRRALNSADDQLDWFRRGPARAACADQQAKTWKAAYKLDGVDTGALLQRVSGKSPLTVMTEAASQMNG